MPSESTANATLNTPMCCWPWPSSWRRRRGRSRRESVCRGSALGRCIPKPGRTAAPPAARSDDSTRSAASAHSPGSAPAWLVTPPAARRPAAAREDRRGQDLKLGDIVDRVLIDSRKLTHYALNPRSPAGQPKAVLFERLLGYTRETAHDLKAQIEAKALNSTAVFQGEDQFGRRYRVDMEIDGLNQQRKVVRTGWNVSPRSRTAKLVTLYIRKNR